MHSWEVAGRRGAVAVLLLGLTLAGCSTSGTVKGAAKPSPSKASSDAGTPANPSSASGSGSGSASGAPGSPTSSSPQPDTTVTKDEALAALKACQDAFNAADKALDTGRLAQALSGSQLATYQVGMIYAMGAGGDKLTQTKVPIALTDPVVYPVRTSTYPRGFFATADKVESGKANESWLMHLSQDHAGAPWLADVVVILGSGQSWPAFAVAADGTLDYDAVQTDKLALSTIGLAAADRTMLADGNAGQPGSPFLNDDVTALEQRWVQSESDSVAPANVAMTVTTDLSPEPMAMPLKDGGQLVLYGTRISLRISQSGQTFDFADQGWAKVAGADHFRDGFTADSIYAVAAVDPPDKAAKIQKIAQNGGVVSLH